MSKLLIRLDDITPDMNWGKFERIRTIFEKYHIKPIIGVVPDNQDPTLSVNPPREDFWDRIRELQQQGWTIAQHGYRHTYVTKNSGMLGIHPYSEFAGLPYEEQLQKLSAGQEILHKQGICAKMFMAPGHTYDRNTLKALKALGFTEVTDGYSSVPYRRKELVFLPCTISSPKIPKKTDTLCLHINHMMEAEFAELEKFCEKQIGIISAAEDISEVKPYTAGIAIEERKNLLMRRIKHFVATNGIMQEYLVRTDCADSARKKRKRLLGLPGLLIHLLFHWRYK